MAKLCSCSDLNIAVEIYTYYSVFIKEMGEQGSSLEFALKAKNINSKLKEKQIREHGGIFLNYNKIYLLKLLNW